MLMQNTFVFFGVLFLVPTLNAEPAQSIPPPTTQPTTLPSAQTDKEEDKTINARELKALSDAMNEDANDIKETEKTSNLSSQPISPLDISVILDVAGGFYSDSLQQEPEENTSAPDADPGHDILESGFRLQQLELALGANVDPYFRFDANIVFTLEGVEIEEAYGTALALPGNFQMRFGQFKSDFGRQNGRHLHLWSFINQPLVLRKFFGVDGSRGLGTEVSWLSPLPWYLEISSAINLGQGRSFVEDRAIQNLNDFVYTAKVDQLFPFSENTALNFGTSFKIGPNEYSSGLATLIGAADFYLRYKPLDSQNRTALSFSGEFMLRSRKIEKKKNTDFGGFVQLVWNFDPRWEVGSRAEYVSGFVDDPSDPLWTKGKSRGALQTTFYPSHFSKIRLQSSLEYTPNSTPNFGALLSFELNTGAHGAHQF